MLFISVIRNRYLHYSFNYVVFALSFRNICRVIFTLYLVFLAKLSHSTFPNEFSNILYSTFGPLNFTQYDSVPLLCDVTSMLDIILSSSNMFFLSFLSLYLFCRQPNPPSITTNLKTLKLYGLSCGIVPIQESWWLAPLLPLPTTTAQFLTYLPILDTSLTQLELPVTGLASVITPTLARLVEMLSSGALPLLVFILLPAYSNWSSQPDNDDIRTGYRRSRRDQSTNAPDSRRDSLTSFGFD